MSTMRCLVDRAACQWTYTHDRQVVVDAAWRQHYINHAEGQAALERYAEHGTVHPPDMTLHRPRGGDPT